MSNMSIAQYAELYTKRFGFALVPIEPKIVNGVMTPQKAPTGRAWGEHAITDPQQARAFFTEHPTWNMGLALGPSGMCSLDIDDEASFKTLLEDYGLAEEYEELAQYPAVQGSPKGRRLLFRVPVAGGLSYGKIAWPSERDPDGSKHKQLIREAREASEAGAKDAETQLLEQARACAAYTVFELRASVDGRQLQDVLPPSIHPGTGEPYRWIVQPAATREAWPEPPAWLYAMWSEWDTFRPQLAGAAPWAVQAPEPRPRERKEQGEGESVIERYKREVTIEEALARYGYVKKGKRWLSPYSSTKLPGVHILPDGLRCFIHHASDPLCSVGRTPVDAFDLYVYNEHGGDASAAAKALAVQYGVTRKQPEPRRQEPPPRGESADKARRSEAPPVERRQAEAQAPATPAATALPFQALGYNEGHYFYLPDGTEQVYAISAAGHTSPGAMLNLAPLEFWEWMSPRNAEKPEQGGVNWTAAASACMEECKRIGVYDEKRVRGRGAWFDEGRSVLHLGDRLVVDGSITAMRAIDSQYVYGRRPAMEETAQAEPATDAESQRFADIASRIRWQSEMQGLLFSGWIAVAPICGALTWRPHIWISGGRGSGKTWVMENIVARVLGRTAYVVQGKTTEPGIRQGLGRDARPVLFDEAESENQAGQRRVQDIIELARQASANSGDITMGTANGLGVSYQIRSAFCMGSINVGIKQAADESRFSVFEIRRARLGDAERFNELERDATELLTDETCARLRARSYRMIPIIRENAQTFARAVAMTEGSRRMGDQVGALLAGAMSLQSDKLFTLDEAVAFVRELDLDDARAAEDVDDGRMLLDAVLQHLIPYEDDSTRRSLTTEELIRVAMGQMGGGIPALPKEARALLRRWGMLVDPSAKTVAFANRHTQLAKILRDTPWAGSWAPLLARIRGDEELTNAIMFPEDGRKVKQRAVVLTLAQMGLDD